MPKGLKDYHVKCHVLLQPGKWPAQMSRDVHAATRNAMIGEEFFFDKFV
jgi:hypothetical protein